MRQDVITRDIMGIQVTSATTPNMIAVLAGRLAAGERLKLAYLNAHTSNLVAADPAFRRILQSFVVLNDGAGVAIASRWLHGQSFPENLNGTDFTPALLAGLDGPRRVFLIGAQPGVAEAAVATLRKIAPQHDYVGVRNGFFTKSEAAGVADSIAAVKADLVLVALGNPGQEFFINEYFETMNCEMAIGVGALFDFLAGRVARAPRWVRAMRLEWVWRLLLEPRRLWKRYILGNVKFISRLLTSRTSR